MTTDLWRSLALKALTTLEDEEATVQFEHAELIEELRAARDSREPEKIAACQNCDWRGPESKVSPDIPDIFERVAPGEVMPLGECPQCNALCHLEDPEDDE
jgi:hypothetical protein